jgi:hypothetical protein
MAKATALRVNLNLAPCIPRGLFRAPLHATLTPSSSRPLTSPITSPLWRMSAWVALDGVGGVLRCAVDGHAQVCAVLCVVLLKLGAFSSLAADQAELRNCFCLTKHSSQLQCTCANKRHMIWTYAHGMLQYRQFPNG